MAGKIIMWLVSFGCGILFFAIGICAKRMTKPMWFWSDSEVSASRITDVKGYNAENARMWQLYSLWYFAAGLAEIWSTILALSFIVLSCTIGIAVLVMTYNKIYRKYTVY